MTQSVTKVKSSAEFYRSRTEIIFVLQLQQSGIKNCLVLVREFFLSLANEKKDCLMRHVGARAQGQRKVANLGAIR